MATMISYYEHPNQYLGEKRAQQVPRVDDEMAMIAPGQKRAFMYRVVRVVWSTDLTQPENDDLTVDVFLEQV